MSQHKIKLTNGAVNLLLSCIGNSKPGWAEDLADIAISSKLLVNTFKDFKPKLVKKPVKSRDEAGKETEEQIEVFDEAWVKRQSEWIFTEKERDGIKRCLTKLAKILPPGRFALELIGAFGLHDDK